MNEQNNQKTGRFLGLPYDWRVPTWKRFKEAWWNPEEHHVMMPKAFGWGYTCNLYEVGRRLHLIH